jgi:BirA family biotin operon repressor/biotin-[acetyl-CoA-carboxylase] ligase
MTTGFPTHATTTRRELREAGWHLWEYDEVTSTNLVAAQLEPWHAVRANRQTAGRGRFQRQWVSDRGGMWLSAVVPVETNSPTWHLLPLTAGVAVCEALGILGIKQLRLRWPNDVLVGTGKLAGVLIDQFQSGRAVVGIGVNVTNHPEVCDQNLNGHVVRLADLITSVPPVAELAAGILATLKSLWEQVRRSSPTDLLPRINALWALPRQVQLNLDGPLVTGEFLGVDAQGRLQLRDAVGQMQFFDPQTVKLLRDLP